MTRSRLRFSASARAWAAEAAAVTVPRSARAAVTASRVVWSAQRTRMPGCSGMVCSGGAGGAGPLSGGVARREA